jgi:hypothetical protein
MPALFAQGVMQRLRFFGFFSTLADRVLAFMVAA